MVWSTCDCITEIQILCLQVIMIPPSLYTVMHYLINSALFAALGVYWMPPSGCMTNDISYLSCSPSLKNKTISVICRTRSMTDNPPWIKVQQPKLKYPCDNATFSCDDHNPAITNWVEPMEHHIILIAFHILTFVNYGWTKPHNPVKRFFEMWLYH